MPVPRPWHTESSETILDLQPWLSIIKDTVKLPSGRVVDDYYRIEAPDYVLISAQRDDGAILMERHYKQCLGRIILTSPAGGVDEGETPLEAARRELVEETGFEAEEWKALGSFVVDGTRGICTAHLFSAKKLKYVVAPKVDDMEQFDLQFLNVMEIRAAVSDGLITLLPDVALLSMTFDNLLLTTPGL